jgi:hypothetical protein
MLLQGLVVRLDSLLAEQMAVSAEVADRRTRAQERAATMVGWLREAAREEAVV